MQPTLRRWRVLHCLALVFCSCQGTASSTVHGEHSGAHFQRISRPSAAPLSSPSKLCQDQIDYYLESRKTKEFAQRMEYAMGEKPDIVYDGNTLFIGHFDVCKTVVSDGEGDRNFTGRYGKAAKRGLVKYSPWSASVDVALFGFCLPSSCEAADLQALIDTEPNNFTRSLSVSNTTFLRDNMTASIVEYVYTLRWDGGAIFGVAVAGLLVALCLIGLVYEIVITTIWERQKEREMFERMDLHIQDNEDSQTANFCMGPEEKGQDDILYKSQGLVGKLVLCISLARNMVKGSSTQPDRAESVLCLHGLRVGAVAWLVVGNTIFALSAIAKNKTFLEKMSLSPFHGFYTFATFQSDIFFMVGGIVLCTGILAECDRNQESPGWRRWAKIYMNRYCRIVPVYMVSLVVWATILPHYGGGPFWPNSEFYENCMKNWWTNLLFINNLPVVNNQCAPWSWYMACDMQFFVVSVPLVALLYKNKRAGLVTIATLLLVSTTVSMVLTGAFSLPLGADFSSTQFDWLITFNPISRYQSYAVGLLTGYIIHTSGKEPQLSKYVSWAVWFLACLLIFVPIMCPGGSAGPASQAGADIFYGLGRVSFVLGLSLIVIGCETNNFNISNAILSWTPFIPISRLSYTAYLYSFTLIIATVGQSRQTPILHYLQVILLCASMLSLTTLLSVLMYLLVEAPAQALRKLAFGLKQ